MSDELTDARLAATADLCRRDPYEFHPPGFVLCLVEEVQRLRGAVAAEREACASICDTYRAGAASAVAIDRAAAERAYAAGAIAEIIRGRGNHG